MTKRAVVLFNLGGPDSQRAVRPFLFNLFYDPAIIALPGPVRWFLAHLIALLRLKKAREIYARIGGKSPLRELTEAQARALEARLNAERAGGADYRVFIAMRYWHPTTDETVEEVKAYGPDALVLLPLYPQFSTTTSASSFAAWRERWFWRGTDVPVTAVCCYPDAPGLVAAHAALLKAELARARQTGPVRVLFSAHGLPAKVIAGGDPYDWQVSRTATALAHATGLTQKDWSICYQSRVGLLEWIGPPLEDELKRAAADGIGVIVLPIAFVSEHSETLVELDMDYRARAAAMGIKSYARVPALATHPAFIDELAELAIEAFEHDGSIMSEAGTRLCPARCTACPHRGA
jgi:ferrochelatase